MQEATRPEIICFGMAFSEAGRSMEHLTTKFTGLPLKTQENNT